MEIRVGISREKLGIGRENESGNQGGNEGWSKRAAVP